MASKTTLTIAELKAYMESVMGDTATKLGWRAGDGDFDEPVNNVLYALGLEDLSTIDSLAEVNQVRMVARVEAWRAAMYYTVHEHGHSAGAPGTGSTNRADIHRHAKEMFGLAIVELQQRYPALGVTLSRRVSVVPISYPGDPYDGSLS